MEAALKIVEDIRELLAKSKLTEPPIIEIDGMDVPISMCTNPEALQKAVLKCLETIENPM